MAHRLWQGNKNGQNTRADDDLQELFVFGYQCKLFRDDEKALEIDQGRHLIPWPDGSSRLIDRFDGRGHLYDLHFLEAPIPHDPSTQTEEEKHIEALCDEERYLELHTDVMEKAMYEEEELKRLNEALMDNSYGAVGFNYDQSYDPAEPTEPEQQEPSVEEEPEVFYPPEELQVPSDMDIPLTNKEHLIIEKTAWFLSTHGAQMEIMMKAKQGNNPQFNFLNYGNILNPYYKHMLQLMKGGKYKLQPQEEEENGLARQDSTSESHDYLHPSLTVNTAPNSSIKEEPLSPQGFLRSVQEKLPVGQLQNSVYAKLVRSMAKHTAGRDSPSIPQSNSGSNESRDDVSSGMYHPLAPPPLPPGMEVMPTSLPAHTAASYSDTYQTASYPGLPPPPGIGPVSLPSSHSKQPPPPGTEPPELPRLMHGPERPRPQPKSEQESPKFHGPAIVPPPPDQCPIIDKMASYVARNGPEFEMTVRAKGDVRFQFLNLSHVHYPYYEFKKQMCLKEQEEQAKKEDSENSSQNKGLSFSIKAKSQETAVLDKRRRALPLEDSDDEGHGGERSLPPLSSEEATDGEMVKEEKVKVVPSTEEAGRKQAEEKLKDRLAQAAREKLAQASKEKQLQAERKRKAMMFINMLQTSDTAPASADQSAGSPGSANVLTPTLSPLGSRSSSPAAIATPTRKHVSPSRTFSPHRVLSAGSAALRRRSRSRSPKRRKRSRSPKRHRSKTPPTAYNVSRRSRSPIRIKPRRSRSRTPKRHHKKSPSRSRSHSRRKSRSPSKSRHKKKKSSRDSRSPSRKSRHKDRKRKRSRSRSNRTKEGSRHKKDKRREDKKRREHKREDSKKKEGRENTKSSLEEESKSTAVSDGNRAPEVDEVTSLVDAGGDAVKDVVTKDKDVQEGESVESSGSDSTDESQENTDSDSKAPEELRAKVRAMLQTMKTDK